MGLLWIYFNCKIAANIEILSELILGKKDFIVTNLSEVFFLSNLVM
jgi:hypothetical protein